MIQDHGCPRLGPGQLARIGDLTVLSRTAVERAVESGASLDDIACALGAGSVLEGSVRMASSRVRIAAHLIEVKKAKKAWTGIIKEKAWTGIINVTNQWQVT